MHPRTLFAAGHLAACVATARSAFSRVPVYEGDRDHIVAVLYLKDFLEVSQQKSIDPEQVLTKEMLRQPLFVPEGMKLDALFRLLRQEHFIGHGSHRACAFTAHDQPFMTGRHRIGGIGYGVLGTIDTYEQRARVV